MEPESSLPKPLQVDELNEQAFHLRLQDTRRALELSLQARDLALQIDYQKGLAYSLFNSSLCHFILADELDVEENAFQALSLFQGLGDENGQARAHNLIASIYHRRTQYQQALDHIFQCLAIRRKIGDLAGESGALSNIAVIYIKMAQYAKALEYLTQSLQVAEATGDTGAIAYALGNIAEVYSEMGDTSQALEYYRRSLDLNRQTNNRAFESGLLAAIGRIYAVHDEHALAIQYLEQSLEITSQTGNLHNRGNALIKLGQSYMGLHRFSDAEAALSEGLEIMKKTGDRYMAAEALNAMGVNRYKQGDPSAALSHLLAALTTAEEIHAELLSHEAHGVLTDVYERLGNPVQALFHCRAYHRIWKQIHSTETERQIQALSAQSEIDKAQQEAEEQRMRSAELTKALQALHAADQQKTQLLHQLEAQAHMLEQLAREDGLTGVANRRWLNMQLVLECERAHRFNRPLSVAMMDLDNFKPVNDRFSHQVGDLVLQKAATLLRDQCRSVDIIGRYGGDEFLLILVESGLEQATQICQRLCELMAGYPWHTIHPGVSGITLSIGLCSNNGDANPERMVAIADEQLYRAKSQGKNQVCGPTNAHPTRI